MRAAADRPPADGALALDDAHAAERRNCREGLLAVNGHEVNHVAVAVLQVLDAADDRGGHLAGSDLGQVKVNAVEALLQVERALGAVRLHAVVVVDAVGHVAGLLGLQDGRARLDGVDGTRVNLEEVALVDGQHIQQVVPAALLDHLGKLGAVVRALAHDDGRARLAVKNVPALLLAQGTVLVLGRIGVVGVHLDGEVALGVDDLHQQGELRIGALGGGNGAKHLAVALPQLGEAHPGKAAAVYLAVSVRVGRDCPALADGAVRDAVPPVRVKLAAAPDLLVEDGLEENELVISCHAMLLLFGSVLCRQEPSQA